MALTLYKEHGRARIQVLTHELTPEEVERLEDELAEAIGAEIVDRSSPEGHEHEDPAEQHAERAAERVEAASAEPERQRQTEPPPRG